MVASKKNIMENIFLIKISGLMTLLVLNSLFTLKTVNAQTYIPDENFIAIPAGSFLMGADIDAKYITAGKKEGWRSIFIQDEFPQRKVQITQPFEMSKYEITNSQYEKFDPDHKKWRGNFMDISEGDNEAVVYVSWDEAVAYTKWLSEQDPDFNYRLPTEAEWEYAARAGTTSPFNNGKTGDIYGLNPFNETQMEQMNYQFPYPFTWTNGCRGWVTWLPENCVGVEDVYPNKDNIVDVDLTVGHSQPNKFGIYDMHGGVEEWVQDWYGPYNENDNSDPNGYATGDFKVARGGSHNNHVQHTRSANRMSSATNDKHYLLGLRVVRAPKNIKANAATLEQPVRPWAENVAKRTYDWGNDVSSPLFSVTSLYELVEMKEDGSHFGSNEQMRQFGFDPDNLKPLLTGPLYTHNHSPTITWSQNGDMLLSWFTGESEIGAELTLPASRGKRKADGSLEWTQPAEFLKAADRNMHSSNLLNNSVLNTTKPNTDFTLHQMASVGVAGRWDKLALGYRQSTDNGATWSPVKMVLELDHGKNNGASMQGNMLQTDDGTLIFVTDDDDDEVTNTGSLVVSTNNGESWERRGHSSTTPGEQRIAGLHAAVVEIDDKNNDGKKDLLAIARDHGKYYDGKAPMSISVDGGNTWARSASVFPSIKSGQRFTLLKLRHSTASKQKQNETPILLTGFANDSIRAKNTNGEMDDVHGLYAALSFDGGKTWPEKYRKVVSPVKGDNEEKLAVAPWQRQNTLSKNRGQKDGYMSVTQTPDGKIYLTDGKIVYTFNLAWLT
jgi:formylglycine-generating enzyme required for sulfatase activity